MDKVPRGVGVIDAVGRGSSGGSGARCLFSLAMTGEIKQLDSVIDFCLITVKSESSWLSRRGVCCCYSCVVS